MAMGTVKTIRESGLSAEEVMDIIPAKPLSDGEEGIKDLYKYRLRALHACLRA